MAPFFSSHPFVVVIESIERRGGRGFLELLALITHRSEGMVSDIIIWWPFHLPLGSSHGGARLFCALDIRDCERFFSGGRRRRRERGTIKKAEENRDLITWQESVWRIYYAEFIAKRTHSWRFEICAPGALLFFEALRSSMGIIIFMCAGRWTGEICGMILKVVIDRRSI